MTEPGLFDAPGNDDSASENSAERYFHPGDHAPLAVRMRPRTIEEVVGQQHLLGPGTPLRRLIEGAGDSSVILFGPPGTGKTTLASLISATTGRHFEALSALSSGVKELRSVITQARRRLATEGIPTVLFIDEVHRFSKTQQDALLAAVENRTVLLVAATTENPSFSVVGPLLSRSLLLKLEQLTDDDIGNVVDRAAADPRGFDGKITLTPDARAHIVAMAGGDARRSLTYLEAAAESKDGHGEITVADVEASVNQAAARYDRDGDQHYDIASALIKSIRGSDVDAALHYLARMIAGGEDPRFIARRLIISASEDIGMADPSALQTAVAAADAVQYIGMPEGRIPLAQAVVHLATSPKSNASYRAIGEALADVHKGGTMTVPPHLRDGHYSGAKKIGNAIGYQYPHDDARGVLEQQYIPDELADRVYYRPTQHGRERGMGEHLGNLRRIIRGVGRKK